MSTRPRQEFIGKYTHDEIWDFAQRLTPVKPSDPAGFSVAAAMIEQLLSERDASEGYPGIAHDFETCKAHLRRAVEFCAGRIDPGTLEAWKSASDMPNAQLDRQEEAR